MRKAVSSAASFLLILILICCTGQNTSAGSDDTIRIDLDIDLQHKDQGMLVFMMEAGESDEPNWEVGFPSDIEPYVNENMGRLLTALKMGGTDEYGLMTSILNNKGDLELEGTKITHSAERGYFGISFVTNFSYSTNGIDAEYSYLDFIYRIEKLFVPSSGGIDGIFDNIAKERELRRIGIDIKIHGGPSLSYSTSSSVSDHSRSINSESVTDRTNAQEFLRSSNDLKIFQSGLLSPATVFISLIAFLLLGYGLLAYIWFRDRFKGLSMVLPIITMIFPILPIWTFFSPGLSFYDLAGGTIWLYGVIFLILVGICNLVNPKVSFRSFEEEKEEQPSIEMPDVIYINKRIFIDRPVRISEEEALDPYEVLDIRRKASWEEIEKAYKARVKEYHPDKFINSPERIHKAAREETERLNISYEKLKRKFGK